MIKRKEYRCFFEGQQEEMYFSHIASKMKEANPNIGLKFKKVSKLNSLENSSTDVPKLAIFDFDLNKIEFKKKVNMCKKTKVKYTSLNFDLWLLLHKQEFNQHIQANNGYVDFIRNNFGLVKMADIKKKSNMEKILGQIEIKDVKNAINNANKIMHNKNNLDKIIVNRNFFYYENPSMNIHEFFDELFREMKI